MLDATSTLLGTALLKQADYSTAVTAVPGLPLFANAPTVIGRGRCELYTEMYGELGLFFRVCGLLSAVAPSAMHHIAM